jgi:hypothetical protein
MDCQSECKDAQQKIGDGLGKPYSATSTSYTASTNTNKTMPTMPVTAMCSVSVAQSTTATPITAKARWP